MILPPIFQIGPVVVLDSGIANKERIAFRPTEPLNLAQYAVLVTYRSPDGHVPLVDQFFWVNDFEVSPPCWIIIFTGQGTKNSGPDPNTGHPVHKFFWGRATTIFNVAELVPVVIRIGGLMVGGHLKPPPTVAELQQKGLLPPQPPPPQPVSTQNPFFR